MPVTILDLAVLGIVLISALLAAVRGFTREVLAIASWAAAAVAAYVLHPAVLPYAKEHISNDKIALAASIAAVFFGTLIIVSFITVKISDLILDSRIGALDRTLGFVFGAARGLLIAVIAFVFFDKLVGEKQHPEWLRDAKLRPLLKETGDQILAMLPEDPESAILSRLKKHKPEGGEPAEPPTAPGTNPPAMPPAEAPQKKTEQLTRPGVEATGSVPRQAGPQPAPVQTQPAR
jgi:membrane protein required for colicin V production